METHHRSWHDLPQYEIKKNNGSRLVVEAWYASRDMQNTPPPTISIIIPAYQAAGEIADCLESIVAQTFQEYEVIVVNDGSTDTTQAIVEHYNERVRLINQNNLGRNPARNRGFREARGNFLLFCDADIIMEPTFLEKLVHALHAHPDASYAYSSFYYGKKAFRLWQFSAERLRAMPYIHTTSLIRREHFPGFDESIQRLQDWDLWLTMLEQRHAGVWIPEYLFTIRTHRGELSKWFPSFALKISWHRFGIRIARIEAYRTAEARIREKHHLGASSRFFS